MRCPNPRPWRSKNAHGTQLRTEDLAKFQHHRFGTCFATPPSQRTLSGDKIPVEQESVMCAPNTTWISDWNPEDPTFWDTKGKVIALRNLIWSIVAEHLGFSIWLIWSIVATKLNSVGFKFTTDQLFQLVAVPGLVGSLMRFPYTFAVTTF